MVSDDEDHPTIAALTLLLAEAYLEVFFNKFVSNSCNEAKSFSSQILLLRKYWTSLFHCFGGGEPNTQEFQ